MMMSTVHLIEIKSHRAKICPSWVALVIFVFRLFFISLSGKLENRNPGGKVISIRRSSHHHREQYMAGRKNGSFSTTIKSINMIKLLSLLSFPCVCMQQAVIVLGWIEEFGITGMLQTLSESVWTNACVVQRLLEVRWIWKGSLVIGAIYRYGYGVATVEKYLILHLHYITLKEVV